MPDYRAKPEWEYNTFEEANAALRDAVSDTMADMEGDSVDAPCEDEVAHELVYALAPYVNPEIRVDWLRCQGVTPEDLRARSLGPNQ